MLPEKWTGQLVGKMHCNRVTYDELAEELGAMMQTIFPPQESNGRGQCKLA